MSQGSDPAPASDESHRQRAQFIKVGQYVEFCGEWCEITFVMVNGQTVLRFLFDDGVHDPDEVSVIAPNRTLLKVRDSI